MVALTGSKCASTALARYRASEHYRLVAADGFDGPAVVHSIRRGSSAASEHYRLAASGIGDVPVTMGSDSYAVNEGVAILAEVAPPMESEDYRGGGEVPRKVYLPLVLRVSA
jgi:hypothetical protein